MNRAALAWALSGAVRYAIATALVALLLTVLLPDVSAERFATTAYLALIFAAIIVAVKWAVFGGVAEGLTRPVVPTFPSVLGFLVGLVIVLMTCAAFVSDPGAELKLIGYCLAAVAIAAFGRARALEWLGAKLSAGGPVAATTRYSAVIGAIALLLSALLPAGIAELLTIIAYGAALVAASTLAWHLAAPAPVRDLILQVWADVSRIVGQFSSEAFCERVITTSLIVLTAAVVMASVLRRPFSEPFATVAYVAAISAAVGVALECLRRRTQPAEPAKDAESYRWTRDRAPAPFLEDLVSALTVESILRYSVIASVAALIVAAPLWRRAGEPFAVLAYTGTIVAAVTLWVQCRRSLRKRSAKTQ
ncbi:MAG TPA: hypothetical protein VGI19_16540 [Candidatus Cybelea sp.]